MSCQTALREWLKEYSQSYQSELNELPRHYSAGEQSRAQLVEDEAEPVQWRFSDRDELGRFANIEQALSLSLHSDIEQFYGSVWAGPLHFDSRWGVGELIQVWNEDDFLRLQQNIIGHLMMKRKLKQRPTWFIGLLAAGEDMICVDNQDGSVWREKPGDEPSEKLADSIADLLQSVTPRVTSAVEYDWPDEQLTDHPGIITSLKRMWRNLFPQK
ncbi:SecY-interacting protein [Shewanella avicenniae]|uniref:Protein Syd n=1 Tax=Shewanella avicenniae TaxID=2814294 RepID=A0ABX7QNH9_9GAMM|nr:SecY-interacting protein [Shewanella avicenniae]QSX32545.1 SecY-interacting protein [Shewanella avicenniae]